MKALINAISAFNQKGLIVRPIKKTQNADACLVIHGRGKHAGNGVQMAASGFVAFIDHGETMTFFRPRKTIEAAIKDLGI